MKRILISGTLVSALILLFAQVGWDTGKPSLVDEKQSAKPAKWEQITFKSEIGKEESVLVLRVWKSAASDSKWPQLALLRLPPPAYKELRKDSKALKAFIDGTQTGKPVFDAPVTITDNCKLPEVEEATSAEDVTWLVTIDHRESRCSCTAFLEHAIKH
jgi:hypothetical protein